MTLVRKIGTLAAALALLLSVTIVTAAPAHASVSGHVTCSDGSGVMGVYITKTSGSGSSGWANVWPVGSNNVQYAYDQLGPGAGHYVSVGCGGSPGNWDVATYGPTVYGDYYDYICIPGYSGTAGGWNRCVVS